MSNNKIYMEGEGVTNLKLFVGVLTQFLAPEGDLQCLQIAVLAEDYHAASTFLAIQQPGWELQSLTDLTAFTWFKWITLDPNCPQAETLRKFVIHRIKAVPVTDETSTFTNANISPGQGD